MILGDIRCLYKGLLYKYSMIRPICTVCKKNFCAVNYKRKDKTYYRSKCSSCARRNRQLPPQTPRWAVAGYKKKAACDKCGFRAKLKTQLTVFHIDGNLNNCAFTNLRTVCLNCVEEIARNEPTWKQGDLQADV